MPLLLEREACNLLLPFLVLLSLDRHGKAKYGVSVSRVAWEI
jgi:hypothetical protein